MNLFTYRASNEQNVCIDKIRISGTIRIARNIFRKAWSGYLLISCDETGQQMISKK